MSFPQQLVITPSQHSFQRKYRENECDSTIILHIKELIVPLKLTHVIISTILLLSLAACSHIAQNFPSHAVNLDNPQDLLKTSIEAYTLTQKLEKRNDRMLVAKKGMRYADLCLKEDEKLAACHYYKALNTGIYYEVRVIGFRRGINIMVKEAREVIGLNPKYDYAGGYRFLGRLYAKIPSFAIGKNAVRKDLDKSIHYLQKAIKIAPQYPENHLFLAESLWEEKRSKEALASLNTMMTLPIKPPWKPMASDWKKTGRKLIKEIKQYEARDQN